MNTRVRLLNAVVRRNGGTCVSCDFSRRWSKLTGAAASETASPLLSPSGKSVIETLRERGLVQDITSPELEKLSATQPLKVYEFDTGSRLLARPLARSPARPLTTSLVLGARLLVVTAALTPRRSHCTWATSWASSSSRGSNATGTRRWPSSAVPRDASGIRPENLRSGR